MSLFDETDRSFAQIRSKKRTRLSDEEIRQAHRDSRRHPLKCIRACMQLFLALITAVATGRYRVPLGTLMLIVATILYVIWVFDSIPDFIPVIGYLDDVALVLASANACARELEEFRQWNRSSSREPDDDDDDL